ncbi:MAG: DMT family transporter [Armatimonadetes bacterium]|nr:DMT family transporter [Armatimonadota bacterium]
MVVPLLTVALLLVTLVWGLTFPIVKDAVADYGVVGFLAIRFALAAAVLALPGLRRATRRTWLIGGAIGLVLAAAYLLQTFGIRYTTATNSGLITGLFVVCAPLWSRVLFGVRTDRLSAAAIAVSLVGLALLAGAGARLPSLGDLLTLGCAVAFGLHIALLGRHSAEHDPWALSLAQLSAATLLFAVAWPLTEPLRWPSTPVWGALLLTALAATAGGFTVQTAAQRRLPPVRVAILLTMEPVFATLFGWVLAGDRLGPLQLAGGALMIAALLVVSLRHDASPSPVPPPLSGTERGRG